MINTYGKFNEADYDTRLEGKLWKDVPAGITELTYDFHHDPITYFVGAAIYSSVTKLGTTIKLETRYQAAPDVWFRYKKFGEAWNLFPNYVCKSILFPTKPPAGIRLVIVVDNQEGAPIDVGMNLYNFTDIESVSPSLGQQGEDW